MAIVVMGVSGWGKSTVAEAIAQQTDGLMVEGDELHDAHCKAKMQRGEPLSDEDRALWLDRLAAALQREPQRTVLSCSALKRRYRDQLRAACPGLKFVFLDLPQPVAQRRVASRPDHWFPAALVSSQFEALEPPVGEPDVLRIDASLPIEQVIGQALPALSDA